MSEQIEHFELPREDHCQAFFCPDGDYGDDVHVHRHEYYELVWCLNDTGSQSIDFQEYPNKSGRIFTISPGQIHASTKIKNNIRIITFSKEFLEYRFSQQKLMEKTFCSRSQSVPYIDVNASEQLESIFNFMEQECLQNNRNGPLIESLLTSFLHYVHRDSVSAERQNAFGVPRITQLVGLVEQHYKSERKCDFYSESMAMTNKRLNQISKQSLGKTVTSLVHERIVLEARRELLFSLKTVKTIAHELGFEDPSYFGRFFLKQTGESPLEFRERIAK